MTDLLTPSPSDSAASLEAEALDAYSEIVVSVAEHIVPSVASLRVAARGREGAGSAVVLAADGYLLTSAHVVAGAERGTAVFADWHEAPFELVGATRCPTWRCCASPPRAWPRWSSATPTRSGSVSWSSPSGTRTASPAR